MRSIILLLIFFPCLVFAQATKEDYGIYSQYLKTVTTSKKVAKIYFVVNETTANNEKNKLDYLKSIVEDLKRNLKGDIYGRSDVYFMFRDFAHTLTKDTLWTALIAELEKKMDQNFKIENNFSTDLQTTVIDERSADKYFKHSKTGRQVERNWARFHKRYPMPSALIEFSEIVSDGQRAVFYFSNRCGGLCGEGDLVFFGKKNGEWKFLAKGSIWNN